MSERVALEGIELRISGVGIFCLLGGGRGGARRERERGCLCMCEIAVQGYRSPSQPTRSLRMFHCYCYHRLRMTD